MQKKVFKYHFIHQLFVLIDFLFILFFLFFISDFTSDLENVELISTDGLAIVLGITTFLLGLVSFVLLILKSPKSISILNIKYFFIFLFLMLGIYVSLVVEKWDKAVFVGLACSTLFIIILLFLINCFKERPIMGEIPEARKTQ